ncbi:signal peptidase [Rhodopirellula europaea 6C]|uniref:Signal peptidase I n=1 Tax=Rhodopirellula europaea 6C TaxID=1263867 RepID=M2A478_9BACT|nr:signal peptidase [Rhodopirellula europaea 6C]
MDAEHWRSVQSRIATSGKPTRSAPRCWHCGKLVDLESASSLTRINPDVVTVVATSARQIQSRLDRGEKPLVVVKREGSVHIKRLLAGPGQIVTADSDGRMLVNGNAIAISDSPHVPIDLDDNRLGKITSRWSSVDNSWWRDQRGIWSGADDNADPVQGIAWLVYEHRNVYRGNVVSRVLDDCPANLGLNRRMNPVDEIGLTFVIQHRGGADAEVVQADNLVHVMVWTESGIRIVSSSIPDQSDEGGVTIEFTPQDVREGETITESDLATEAMPALSPTSPIAIGLNPRAVMNAQRLQLWRSIAWRAPAQSRWELQTDEWFAAGDNVPVSVDSRTWGPVQTDQIVGVCQPNDRSVKTKLSD